MKKTAALVLIIALAIAALGVTGCDTFHDYNKDANTLIERANKHLTNYQSLDTSVQALATKLDSIPLTPKGAKTALATTAAIRKTLAAQKSELGSATVEIQKVKKLKVSDEMKKYADMEVAAIAVQVKVVDEAGKLYDEMDKTYIAVRDKTGTTKQVEATMVNLDKITESIRDLTEEAAKAQEDAAKYFNKSVANQ